MIEAHIVGPQGSLYISAPATPYDLQNLRTHVSEATATSPHRVLVDLTLDRAKRADRALAPQISHLVRELTSRGVAVRVR